ncbi:hypothetical protein Nepgr_023124 [Nepenthes gracilis]|uniref:Uncharacterized protein n=1 Tax=Nepenthes gracilis TaxID=150966 RepID=A0AAD3XXF3_NEPGR|nr:hypothetical protein Nepgr_023124 [Nepenthes gracilis]
MPPVVICIFVLQLYLLLAAKSDEYSTRGPVWQWFFWNVALPVLKMQLLHATAALFEPVFRFVDDEAFLIPCLIPLVWRGFPLFYHDCFIVRRLAQRGMQRKELPGLWATVSGMEDCLLTGSWSPCFWLLLCHDNLVANNSSMVGFPAGRVFGVRNVFEESHVMLI